MTKIHLWVPNIFEFKGGIQVYSEFLIKALKSLNYENCLVCLKHDRQIPKAEVEKFLPIQFYCSGQWPLPLRTLSFSTQLLYLAIQQKPDLIITTHLNFTPLAYYLKRFLGISYWTIAHGIDSWNITNPKIQRSLQYADLILAVSCYTRNRLLKEQNLNPNQVKLLPNTFDQSRFKPTVKSITLLNRFNIKSKQPIILTVSRLDSSERYKGYDQIIKALPKIKVHIPDIHYILVGKGNDRPRIEKLIKDLNLSSCVTLAGFVADQELCEYYNLCDIFAMPSKGEGFGIVYLEAMACGKPTLGGNQDGAIDALVNGSLGALVDPDNVEEIADTLIQILQGTYPNPLMYNPTALRQKVIDTYGFAIFQNRLITLLRENGFSD
jgi:glycosyltransferase involved in cell wall biosynthesis